MDGRRRRLDWALPPLFLGLGRPGGGDNDDDDDCLSRNLRKSRNAEEIEETCSARPGQVCASSTCYLHCTLEESDSIIHLEDGYPERLKKVPYGIATNYCQMCCSRRLPTYLEIESRRRINIGPFP